MSEVKISEAALILDRYDTGLLGDGGGGDVNWWWDYIRSELERAHEFYQDQADNLHPQPAELAEQQGVGLPLLPEAFEAEFTAPGMSPVSVYTAEQMQDYARAALAATGKQQVGEAVQDNRFPGGFADAITYVNELEELAEALHEKVFGHGSDGESGASTVLQMTLHQLNEKPEQVGEVQWSND